MSGYKEELHDSNVSTYVFRKEDKARKMMEKIARGMYEDSDTIQEADGRYFEIYENCIYLKRIVMMKLAIGLNGTYPN